MTSGKESPKLGELTPPELVLARCEALRRGDFRFVFFSYHPDAPFLQAFPSCADYLHYAEEALRGRFRIEACEILQLRTLDNGEAQVLFMLQVATAGEVLQTVELARLLPTAEGWRYHSGAKRPRTDFDGPLQTLTFEAFLDSQSLLFF